MRCNLLMLFLVCGLFWGCRTQNNSDVKEAYSSTELVNIFGVVQWEELKFDSLPTQSYLANRGWPAHYWPSYLGGLNKTYFGQTKSPLKKFEDAFAELISAANKDYKNGDLVALEKKRALPSSPSWFGICDGSSEASLYNDEPVGTRNVNGQIFYAFEVKALLSYFTAMSQGQRKFIYAGNRVDFDDPKFDDIGRGVDSRYRDINPALMHLVLSNYLGIKRQGVIADIIPGRIVLNFPIRGYKVLSSSEITDPGAITAMKKRNSKATKFVNVKLQVIYGESHRFFEPLPSDPVVDFNKQYEYTLELDSKGHIIGGEWLNGSKNDHPDFLWMPRGLDTPLEQFETTRLAKKLKVGPALSSLLQADHINDGSQAEGDFITHPDNFSGYAIFKNEASVPVPSQIQSMLDR